MRVRRRAQCSSGPSCSPPCAVRSYACLSASSLVRRMVVIVLQWVPAASHSQGLILVHLSAQRKHFCGLQTSTFRLDVSTCCGLCSQVASAKTSQVELRSGRLLWLQ